MPTRQSYSHRIEDDDDPQDGITRGDAIVINLARQALGHAIEELAPR
jgi:hypothetical protein